MRPLFIWAHSMTRKRKTLIVVVSDGAAAGRGAHGHAVLRRGLRQRQLAALDSYDGHVGDIDIHLWRGAYSIDDIEIVKTGASRPVPFFRADRIDLSVEWRSLFRGSIVSEASFFGPEVNLVQGKTAADSQLGKEENWNARLEEMFPFRFNTIDVTDGTVRFLAPGHQHARRDHRATCQRRGLQSHQRDRFRTRRRLRISM